MSNGRLLCPAGYPLRRPKLPSNRSIARAACTTAWGKHYDAIARIRQRLEHEPWEHRDLSDLCRKLRLPSDFDVFQLCWQPDYNRFYFDQLKKRSINIFLFRGEFIFELARTAVAEVPQLGNTT